MIFHIVKQNETIKDLIFRYGLDKSEIISNNQHISDWNTLIPGVKLKIPVVNNNLYEHLEEVEPFIEDYYQKDIYNANEPAYVNNESNLINDEIYQVKQSPELVNQTGDITIPVKEEPIPNSQSQEIHQTGDISVPLQEEEITNSHPQEIKTGDITVPVQEVEVINQQVVETEKAFEQEVTSEEMNVNIMQHEAIQQPDQYVQENKVNSQIQTNNYKYPVYYRINPYYRRRVYYDPYRKRYFYF